MEKLLKQTAKGAMVIFIGLAFGSILRYGTYILFARLLGPEDYGLISLGMAMLGIFAIFSLLGFNQGIPRFIGYYRKEEITRGIIKTAFQYSLTLSVTISIIFIFFSTQIANLFNNLRFAQVLPFFMIALPLYVLTEISVSIFMGIRRVNYKVYTKDFLESVLLPLNFFVLFKLGFGIQSAAISFVISYGSSAIVSLFLVNKKINLFKKSQKITKKFLSFSWPLLISGVFFLVIKWSDILILGIFEDSEQVGVYNTALPTSMGLTMILTSFNFIFLPMASELFSEKKIEQLNFLYKTVTRWMFIFAFPIFLVIFFFPKHILTIIFGDAYAIGGIALAILSVGVLINISTGSVGNILLAVGKSKLVLLASSLATGLNIILNIILIPIYGLVGAAIATAVAMSSVNLGFLYFAYKNTGAFPFDLRYLKHIFAAIIPVAVIYFSIKHFFEIITIPIAIIFFIVYLCAYTLLTLMLKGVTKEDIVILKAIEKKMGVRIKPLRNFFKKFI